MLYYAERALLPAVPAARVLIEVTGGRFASVTPEVNSPPAARRLPGVVLPGFVNAHSHAFHRALRPVRLSSAAVRPQAADHFPAAVGRPASATRPGLQCVAGRQVGWVDAYPEQGARHRLRRIE